MKGDLRNNVNVQTKFRFNTNLLLLSLNVEFGFLPIDSYSYSTIKILHSVSVRTLNSGTKNFFCKFSDKRTHPRRERKKPNLLAHLLNTLHELVEVISGLTIETNAA
jgi:hypothetical protein